MTRVDVIKARLLEDSVITAMTAGRIYYQNCPSKVYNSISGTYDKNSFPFIVFRQIGSSYSRLDDINIHEYAYTIECYGLTMTVATNLANYVKYNLNLSTAKKVSDANVKLIAGYIGGERTFNEDNTKINLYEIDVLLTFKEVLTWT